MSTQVAYETDHSSLLVIQHCQVHCIFVFYVFHCNLKSYWKICEISIIILICPNLGSTRPLQQKIKLPSPYIQYLNLHFIFFEHKFFTFFT